MSVPELSDRDYRLMFSGCQQVTAIPELPHGDREAEDCAQVPTIAFDGFDWGEDMEKAYK